MTLELSEPRVIERVCSPEHNKSCLFEVAGLMCGWEFFEGDKTHSTDITIACIVPFEVLLSELNPPDFQQSCPPRLAVWVAMELLRRHLCGLPLPAFETGIERYFREFGQSA